jgi:hypothetical protein
MHAVLRALHSRNVRCEHRPILASVEMAPPALTAVIAPAPSPALRTLEIDGRRSCQFHHHLAGLQQQLHIYYRPRRLDAEDLSVQLSVSHPARLCLTQLWPFFPWTTHTQPGRAPLACSTTAPLVGSTTASPPRYRLQRSRRARRRKVPAGARGGERCQPLAPGRAVGFAPTYTKGGP